MPEMNAVEQVLSTFPWLSRLPGIVDLLTELSIQGVVGDAMLAEVRKTSAYQSMFPAIRRPDGTMRMNEARYLERTDEYRTVLRQFGDPSYAYDDPNDYVPFLSNDIDPNELRDRFQVYRTLQRSGEDVRDAFYIYAGIRMSDDDLYEYVVNPAKRQQMDSQYNQSVTAGKLDYQTWITRATEAGLSRVVRALEGLREDGVEVGGALSRIRSLDPDFARQMMDVLYTGGGQGDPLSFNDLLNSFELALIGGAAGSQAGVALPTMERVQAIRQAGIDRSKAMEGYGRFARDRAQMQGQLLRATAGARRFSQDDFERAVFLQQGDVQQMLGAAQAQEEGLGRRSGSVGFGQSKQGLLEQKGFQPGLR
jgi:hypothetical protein